MAHSHIDLESLRCPKFDDLHWLTSVSSCGHHQDPVQHHCSKVECYHFVQWMRSQRGRDRDRSYVNHDRAQWFLEATKPSPLDGMFDFIACPTSHKRKGCGLNGSSSACSQVCGQSQTMTSFRRIVPLEVFNQDNTLEKIPFYAILDNQLTDFFIAHKFFECLNVDCQLQKP